MKQKPNFDRHNDLFLKKEKDHRSDDRIIKFDKKNKDVGKK